MAFSLQDLMKEHGPSGDHTSASELLFKHTLAMVCGEEARINVIHFFFHLHVFPALNCFFKLIDGTYYEGVISGILEEPSGVLALQLKAAQQWSPDRQPLGQFHQQIELKTDKIEFDSIQVTIWPLADEHKKLFIVNFLLDLLLFFGKGKTKAKLFFLFRKKKKKFFRSWQKENLFFLFSDNWIWSKITQRSSYWWFFGWGHFWAKWCPY